VDEAAEKDMYARLENALLAQNDGSFFMINAAIKQQTLLLDQQLFLSQVSDVLSPLHDCQLSASIR
jgi:hypothetical protein